jgi:pimeloyl-ACP methyl ester carboxylesterase
VNRFTRVMLALLVVLAGVFLLVRVPDTEPAAMWAKYGSAPSQKLVLANGRTVHLRDEGPRDAPVLVLLHGSNADLHTWQPWVDRLAKDYRVIRFDQRGHGLTGPAPDGNYALDAFVADVDAVADKLALDRFVLAGNSMGGGIAMAYGMNHPDRLSGLVLVDAGGADIQRKGGGNLLFTIAAIPVLNKLVGQITPRSLVQKSLSQSVTNQAIITPAAVDRYWELARYPGNREATLKRFGQSRKPFTAEQVAAVDVPTLVMWGEDDSLIPFAAAGWYMDHLPDATLAAYKGIGHIPMEEHPAQSSADMRAFMQRLAADDGGL